MSSSPPSKVYSGALIDLESQIIEVETDVTPGLRCFTVVGLPDKAVQESRRRIEAALKSAAFKSPYSEPERILVNLAPADLKKEGALYDLPIALGYLLASNQIEFSPEKKLFVGELSLGGKLRPIRGALSFALSAKEHGFRELFLPQENASEAGLIESIDIIPARTLNEIADHLTGKRKIRPFITEKQGVFQKDKSEINIGWIKGQRFAKRALEISSAGGHHLMMMGPPGTGKTLLAKSICSILPQLSFEDSLEVTKIYSVAGRLPKNQFLIKRPPFRSPHHTSSEAALIGGGSPPRPGEITLAHRGILFLDEFPEFHRDVLESLRQPLEENEIKILRARHRTTFPAQFTMICAANPCPCGHYGSSEKKCVCTASQVQKYQRKMQGPLMDRIDIFIEVPSLKYEKLIKNEREGEAEEIRERVEAGRKRQARRFEKEGITLNSEMDLSQIKKYCPVPEKAGLLLKKYVNSGKLSARGFHRVLKVSRTIADLEGAPEMETPHIAEALMYRLRQN